MSKEEELAARIEELQRQAQEAVAELSKAQEKLKQKGADQEGPAKQSREEEPPFEDEVEKPRKERRQRRAAAAGAFMKPSLREWNIRLGGMGFYKLSWSKDE